MSNSNGQGHEDGESVETGRNAQPTRSEGRENAFPLQLHYVLSELEKDGKDHIFSWLPHGRAIKVHDKTRFVTEILPNWFRQTKIESFQRQLNMYGFKRITTGRDKNAYFHELFLRGCPDLTNTMVRHKIKGAGPRKAASPESEPDLWSLPPMPRLGRNEGYAKWSAAPCASSVGSAYDHKLNYGLSVLPVHANDTAQSHPVASALPLTQIPCAFPFYQSDRFFPSVSLYTAALNRLPTPNVATFDPNVPFTTALAAPVMLSGVLGSRTDTRGSEFARHDTMGPSARLKTEANESEGCPGNAVHFDSQSS